MWSVVAEEPIIAVALLTEQDLARLGSTLTHVWPIEELPGFEELLAAIDEADRRLQPVNQSPSPVED